MKFLAPMWKRFYEKVRKLKEDGEYSKEMRDAVKDEECSRMYELWRRVRETEHPGRIYEDGHSSEIKDMDGTHRW